MTNSHREEKDGLEKKKPPKNIILASGRKCTVSGEWESEGPIATTVYVSKGDPMPLYCGKTVKWKLVRNG
ncbi:hypothetical protein [Chryseobacterium sp. FH1]|uniref:hypothetical protein n=1 Tax=Chryseobacterium sp. FH1 TaxID=1233951 RepID=UPI0005545DAE|nr:hypothetical protein [Chryseobacterium sp. FH1]